jgi:outer membrane protein assembly factor BamB
VKPDRKLATLISCLLVLSFVVVQASDRHARLGQMRSFSLPASSILDENAQPVIASSGKVGFVSSVTNGAVISFSVSSGKMLSSIVVGETAGPLSLIETAGRRLIAVASANDPGKDSPATVSIIDATSARSLSLKSLLVLPQKAAITQATRALLTSDGKFCLIASSFDEPALYSFDVETGQIVSELKLAARPSEIALFDDGKQRKMAIASAQSNNLSVIAVDEQGALSSLASLTPSGARFGEANNPVFSGDGRTIYIAASTGDQLYLIDADSGIQLDSISVPAPQRITVTGSADNVELVAVTSIRRADNDKRGGVTVIKSQHARLFPQTEFAPPEGVEFSRANNVVFTSDASTAFVGSTTGVLFAFNTTTGDLESYQAVGSELRRVALSEKSQTVAAVRSADSGDEVVIISFDLVNPDDLDPTSPIIDSLVPGEVEQGRMKNLSLIITGQRFTEGSSVIVNGAEMAAEIVQNGRALETKLPRALFDQIATISIQVKGAGGTLSQPRELKVIRPGTPILGKIRPEEVAGPSGPFTLRVTGQNFRASSTIFVAGQALNTQQVSANTLQAVVPANLVSSVGQLKVLVRDLAVSDLASANYKDLTVYGPRITELTPTVNKVMAGGGDFTLWIKGQNFRNGSQVEINGQSLPESAVHYTSRSAIKLVVPKSFFQDAGKLSVAVRNAEGSVSEAGEIDVHAPQIVKFGQAKLMAGIASTRIDIRGQNFRRGARVYVGNGSDMNVLLEKRQIRFRNSTHIAVTLKGDLNKLLAQPGTLQFNVVNPNDGDGVSSKKTTLDVVGPNILNAQIETVQNDDRVRRMVIEGANFRKGAMVEFVKGDAVIRQQLPESIKGDRLTITIRARTIDAMGRFRVRVVNPGNVASIAFQPQQGEMASGNEDD